MVGKLTKVRLTASLPVESAFFMISPQRRLELIKKNGGTAAPLFMILRHNALTSRIEDLRRHYKNATTDAEKQRITKEAKELKEELTLYNSGDPSESGLAKRDTSAI